VLEFVLDDHPDDETTLEQRIAAVERKLRKQCEHGFAYPPHIRACSFRLQDRQPAAVGTCMGEGVVEVVVLRRHGTASADPSQQPQLLEVADVRQIPDQRRLQRRDLARQLLIGERFQQILCPPSRPLESVEELRG
jgi:hypothetical protein